MSMTPTNCSVCHMEIKGQFWGLLWRTGVFACSEFCLEVMKREDFAPFRYAIVNELPACDFCDGHPHDRTRAQYDGATKIRRQWAFMCGEHWESVGIGELGLGKGQRLVAKHVV